MRIMVLALVVAGCASPQGWWRANTTEAEFNRDRFACDQAAASAFPMVSSQVMTSPGVNAAPPAPQTTCTTGYGGVVTCNTQRPGLDASIYNRPPTYATVDANAANRGRHAQSCLMARGYTRR
jgi:hypothetical protein